MVTLTSISVPLGTSALARPRPKAEIFMTGLMNFVGIKFPTHTGAGWKYVMLIARDTPAGIGGPQNELDVCTMIAAEVHLQILISTYKHTTVFPSRL